MVNIAYKYAFITIKSYLNIFTLKLYKGLSSFMTVKGSQIGLLLVKG